MVLVELYNVMMRKQLRELDCKPRWPLIFLIMLSDIGQDTVLKCWVLHICKAEQFICNWR